MKKMFAMINYSTPEEDFLTDKGLVEKKICIDTSDTFGDVKVKILEAFGNPETLGKIYLQQQIEIRDLDSTQYKDKKFCAMSTFIPETPIEVHFRRVPILFLLFTSSEKPRRHLLHIDPTMKIAKVEKYVKKEFQIIEGVEIELVHQGYQLIHEKCLNDFNKFDPAHSIQIIPHICKDEEDKPPLT
ncbi:MAG: hypothetical protein ACFFCS_01295 [Candidatus Hodarchaeota archaeon]